MGEWIETVLGDVAAETSWAFATGPFGSAVSAKNFKSTGIPMLRGGNLSDDVGVRIVEDDLVFVSEDLADHFARSSARRGDLVFTCWGTVGQIGLIDESTQFERYLVSNKQMKMTPDPSRVDSTYIYYYLSQPQMIDFVRGQAIGSSVPGFNLGQLKALPVRLPALEEQRSIAEALGALDDKIAANDRVQTLTRQLLAEMFRALKVDDEPMSEADAAELADLIEINPKLRVAKADAVTYLEMKNLPDSAMTVTDWSAREPRGGARFQNGDTLLARITPCLENGKVGYVDFLDDGEVAIGSTEFIVMRSREGVPAALPYFLATSSRFRDFAIRHMAGTTGRQRLAASDLGPYSIRRPDGASLRAFGDATAPLFDRVKAAVDESRRLAATRDELLPLLMSGKLRVKDAVATAEGAL